MVGVVRAMRAAGVWACTGALTILPREEGQRAVQEAGGGGGKSYGISVGCRWGR